MIIIYLVQLLSITMASEPYILKKLKQAPSLESQLNLVYEYQEVTLKQIKQEKNKAIKYQLAMMHDQLSIINKEDFDISKCPKYQIEMRSQLSLQEQEVPLEELTASYRIPLEILSHLCHQDT